MLTHELAWYDPAYRLQQTRWLCTYHFEHGYRSARNQIVKINKQRIGNRLEILRQHGHRRIQSDQCRPRYGRRVDFAELRRDLINCAAHNIGDWRELQSFDLCCGLLEGRPNLTDRIRDVGIFEHRCNRIDGVGQCIDDLLRIKSINGAIDLTNGAESRIACGGHACCDLGDHLIAELLDRGLYRRPDHRGVDDINQLLDLCEHGLHFDRYGHDRLLQAFCCATC